MKDQKNIDQKVKEWLSEPYDTETREEVKRMIKKASADEIADAFYKDLEFGTGGLRGIMGPGTNRINKYTLGKATQGLSNYLKKSFASTGISIALAHDNRNNAREFANIVANVFSANGIKVYFFEDLRPTPELSFAIRHLNCQSGVMLTASHNPREYSGYKAYWSDGGQVVSPHDKNIIEEVNAIKNISEINFTGRQELIEFIGEEIDRAFLQKVSEASVYPEVCKKQSNLRMVFSPIHGAAVDMVPKAIRNAGFKALHLVEEQCTPDGDFPTVIYPNPEEEEALTMAIEKAEDIDAELVMASDPDGDRVGIAIKANKGGYKLLNGNQTAALLFHYVMNGWKEKNLLSGNEYIVKTIVTSQILDKMADQMNIKCYNTLTGFKFIGNLMTALEANEKFMVGGEESYGYLIGDHVRDKDAVVSCALIAEMTAWYKEQGKSLEDGLIDIYLKYGFFKERLISFTKKGPQGAKKISEMMENFRSKPPKSIDGEALVLMKDFLNGFEKNLTTGLETQLDFPKSNVLQFITASGCMVSARPSGTEPKIKFYISVNTPLNAVSDYEQTDSILEAKMDRIAKEMGVL